VVGHCQGSAVAQALRVLLPDAEVRYRSLYGMRDRRAGIQAFLRQNAAADAVFASELAQGDLPEDARAHLMPTVLFAAFHPDLVYVGDAAGPAGRHVPSPVGSYHSALALYGFRRGLSAEDTLKLFCEPVYRHVGYLDAWEAATGTQLRLAREVGWDFGPLLARWSRRGAFMHSVNHPRMFVAADLARALLDRAAIPFVDFDIEPFLHDELLAQGSWPVYPEIGRVYGLSGGYSFLPRSRRGSRRPQPMTLGRFVAESFALYRQRRSAELSCPRVETWLAEAALPGDLGELAGVPNPR
jgi:hypothetical protein